jgi:hypothetical protein
MTAPSLTLVDADRNWIVYGDTKAAKDQLRALGGMYQPKMTVPGKGKMPAWQFLKDKANEKDLRDFVTAYGNKAPAPTNNARVPVKPLPESESTEEEEPTEKPSKPVKPVVAASTTQIYDYGDKGLSYAVLGDTFNIKEGLKDLGAMFKRNLTHPQTGLVVPGWILAKSTVDLPALLKLVGVKEIIAQSGKPYYPNLSLPTRPASSGSKTAMGPTEASIPQGVAPTRPAVSGSKTAAVAQTTSSNYEYTLAEIQNLSLFELYNRFREYDVPSGKSEQETQLSLLKLLAHETSIDPRLSKLILNKRFNAFYIMPIPQLVEELRRFAIPYVKGMTRLGAAITLLVKSTSTLVSANQQLLSELTPGYSV